MKPTIFEIGAAAVMVAVSVALVVWIRRYMAAASERRMMSMMKRAGLDPEIGKAWRHRGDHQRDPSPVPEVPV